MARCRGLKAVLDISEKIRKTINSNRLTVFAVAVQVTSQVEVKAQGCLCDLPWGLKN